MLKTKQKAKVIDEYKKHAKDTGSAEVQIALLSETIDKLTDHLKKNTKDNHSRRGLLKMVAKRRRLLAYLARTNKKAHDKIAKKLGLRK